MHPWKQAIIAFGSTASCSQVMIANWGHRYWDIVVLLSMMTMTRKDFLKGGSIMRWHTTARENFISHTLLIKITPISAHFDKEKTCPVNQTICFRLKMSKSMLR